MIWGDLQRRIAAFRRQKRKLEKLGYRLHETDWEIIRGGRNREVILDAVISVDGKYVYTLLGQSPTKDSTP